MEFLKYETTKREGDILWISENEYLKIHNGKEIYINLPTYIIEEVGYNTSNSCHHEFKFEEKVEFPTCHRTNDVSNCIHCNAEYDVTYKVMTAFYQHKNTFIEQLGDKFYNTPYPHYCVFRPDGTCGSKFCFPIKKDQTQIGSDKTDNVYVGNCLRNCPITIKHYKII